MASKREAERAAPGSMRTRRRLQVFFDRERSRTKQSFKAECDINNIMRKFEKTGLIEHQARFQGRYGDFTNLPQSYHEAVNQVLEAEEMFMTLPAKVRAHFDNDPGSFLAAVDDPARREELVELGLLRPNADNGAAEPAKAASDASASPGGPEGAPDGA